MKQQLGQVAWEETHKKGKFSGWHYCVGYCDHCGQKIVIDEEGIKEFNQNASPKKIIISHFLQKFRKIFSIFFLLGKLKIRIEIKESEKNI
jgi:hypothetical protein